MGFKCDYHIHTVYCDGKNSPEELVKVAIDKGYKVLGFSGHSYVEFDKETSMSPKNEDKYYIEINKLKQKYAKKLEILCGIEMDYYTNVDPSRFDYAIGSVHYMKKGDKYYPLDLSADELYEFIKVFYNGDFSEFAKDYFQMVSDVVTKTNASIIGHIDLITKFKNRIEIKKDDRYYKAAFDAIKKLVKFNVPFEINVGAISRGYRNSPYPEDTLLKEINRLGGDIVINSDCHNSEYLGQHYDTAVALAKRCGFEKQVTFTNGGKKYIEL